MPQFEQEKPASWLANLSRTKAVLEDFGLYTKHSLGQNFLVQDWVIKKILDLAELSSDLAVFEVGPGIGTLSVALLEHAGALVSVEADKDLQEVLSHTTERDSDHFALIFSDALKISYEQLVSALEDVSSAIPHEPSLLVSNLPYQVAATIIGNCLETMPKIERLVCMVQAEVADRISAEPGSKIYGAFTAKMRLYGEVTGRFEVGPENFVPAPHVNSAVIRIDRKDFLHPLKQEPLTNEEKNAIAKLIDASFAQRRKTLRNNLSHAGFEKEAIDQAFSACKLDASIRAERLSTSDFVLLYEELH